MNSPGRYRVTANDAGKRIDRVVRQMLNDVPLGAIARAIRTGKVRVNGKPCDHDLRVREDDVIELRAIETTHTPAPVPVPRPSDAGVDTISVGKPPVRVAIIYRDAHLLALNKPAGIEVHGPDSLTEAVVRTATRSGWVAPSLSFQPGPVHRLDRITTGVQLFALSLAGARAVGRSLADREVCKLYLAVLRGRLVARQEVTAALAYDHRSRTATVESAATSHSETPSKDARTAFVPLAYDGANTVVACVPRGGRTHQIRAHAAHIGHPLAGDTKYGGSDGQPEPGVRGALTRPLLHAAALVIPAPLIDSATLNAAPLLRESGTARLLRGNGGSVVATAGAVVLQARLSEAFRTSLKRAVGDLGTTRRRAAEVLMGVCTHTTAITTMDL